MNVERFKESNMSLNYDGTLIGGVTQDRRGIVVRKYPSMELVRSVAYPQGVQVLEGPQWSTSEVTSDLFMVKTGYVVENAAIPSKT